MIAGAVDLIGDCELTAARVVGLRSSHEPTTLNASGTIDPGGPLHWLLFAARRSAGRWALQSIGVPACTPVETRKQRGGESDRLPDKWFSEQSLAAMPLNEVIQLSPYDPSWTPRFEAEQANLAAAIGKWVVDGIHHIGSTAVPNLDAKPIIDILAGVRDLGESRACFESLAELDYLYAPYLADEMHWFLKPHPNRRTHHLHLVPVGSKRYADELAFRDRLRADSGLAEEYVALKRDLARRFARDREAYTNAKSGFIRDALGQKR